MSLKLRSRARPPKAAPADEEPALRVSQHLWPAVTGLALGLLALGPALGSGFVLSYDMVFVPAPPVGFADLGSGGGPPRAVPSDLIVALAARILPRNSLKNFS